ncbi:HAD family hydrolase [Halapricum hydrolyticum]|uniref:HAD family hydrolase n=1 Tax=Halapricum hydrolyticum TaxID=2979991 RepID=A0AAE3I9X9_9EURY|nr:HAD family hydrolase [Halapricum hydrolyticum]MCU4716626.1 HAD family hydrolase [Halapricum hydrolyticum]MCU4725769.1 HAD family hydrolase [Halapricum hydrolyticum]
MTDAYDAVIYDLDGTLVELDVDWAQVRRRVAAVLEARGVETGEATLWQLFDRAREAEHYPAVENRVAEFEREGARTSSKLPLAEELPWDGPTGVVSLNAESACRIALEVHGLDSAVDVLIGRDTVEESKPHPQPLRAALSALDVSPDNALFVGDSASDAETARRAGVDFQSVADRLDRRRA